jgi:hypothetical protein
MARILGEDDEPLHDMMRLVLGKILTAINDVLGS